MSEPDWPHETHDPDAMSHVHGGDVCPWCGTALRYDDEVVHAETGERGTVLEIAPDDVSETLLCKSCHFEALEEHPEWFNQTRVSDFE